MAPSNIKIVSWFHAINDIMPNIAKSMLQRVGHMEGTNVTRITTQIYEENVNGNVGKVDLGV